MDALDQVSACMLLQRGDKRVYYIVIFYLINYSLAEANFEIYKNSVKAMV